VWRRGGALHVARVGIPCGISMYGVGLPPSHVAGGILGGIVLRNRVSAGIREGIAHPVSHRGGHHLRWGCAGFFEHRHLGERWRVQAAQF